jgi:hypothetical protein
MVMALLIDDGIPSRGHRKNILNPSYGLIGVAAGQHPEYRIVCVIRSLLNKSILGPAEKLRRSRRATRPE